VVLPGAAVGRRDTILVYLLAAEQQPRSRVLADTLIGRRSDEDHGVASNEDDAGRSGARDVLRGRRWVMSERKIVPGSEKRRKVGARKIGPADPNERVEVTVVLRPPTPVHTVAAKTDPTVLPRARKYATRDEVEAELGASEDVMGRISQFASEWGLEVVDARPEERTVALAGSVAAMSKVFGVKLDLYEHPEGKFRGRSGPITVPAEIADIVQAVLGLDDRPQAHPHLRMVEARSHANRVSLTAKEVAQLYDFPSDVTGAGQCIAIIELGGGYERSDLKTYFSELGITAPKVRTVSVDGGRNNPGVDTNSDGEVMLDIEVAGAVAPGAQVVVYFAPNTDRGFLDAVNRAIHDKSHRPSVVSISWGGPEADWTQQALDAFNQVFQVAASLGVTVCAAAGDGGSTDGKTDGLQHVDFPASSPFVLACGGTRLETLQGKISRESVWNDATDSATGGGISDVFDVPVYQHDAKVPKSANPGGRIGRGVPDVSGDADPVTGYKVIVDGQAMVIGGTSAVAPLWAGLVALLNQKIGAHVGQLQPLLYAHPEALRDIVDGGNGAYHAGPQWDACTGLGSPNGAALVKVLAGG
jgi:kumamolisin